MTSQQVHDINSWRKSNPVDVLRKKKKEKTKDDMCVSRLPFEYFIPSSISAYTFEMERRRYCIVERKILIKDLHGHLSMLIPVSFKSRRLVLPSISAVFSSRENRAPPV